MYGGQQRVGEDRLPSGGCHRGLGGRRTRSRPCNSGLFGQTAEALPSCGGRAREIGGNRFHGASVAGPDFRDRAET